MGKPALNDLRSGLATAPVLYAAEEHPELLPLIQRRFKEVRPRLAAAGCAWLRLAGAAGASQQRGCGLRRRASWSSAAAW